uniref:Myosin IXA n=1 Tax=Paramormyrops kingsleyae TaxID=1676925 RepID=A0A3B3TDD5_9TELE
MNLHDVGVRRRFEDPEFTLRIYPGIIAEGTIYCPVTGRKNTTAAEVISHVIDKLQLDRTKCYVLAEVKEFGGEEWILNPIDCPVQRMMLWPRMALENRFGGEDYRFLLREKNLDGSIDYGSLQMWLQVTEERRRLVERGFLPQPPQKDYDDLCNLPNLNEKTLLDNLRGRFKQEKIYTYVGSILIVINPFKFLPIYNPKYVKMYDNHQLGKLEPHIYAVADVAYHAMLQRRRNQCIVISGESGSGKTQSTNFLIHHLTALSQKGFASGVEQIILGAGPVLEAFGNAKTAHNNNSSRFGKFIQVNYQESGTVGGAYVEKYLLEKSRLVYQEHNERNYHVFYYLLAGASEEERAMFHLQKPEEYHYLNQVGAQPHWHAHWIPDCFTVEGEDLKHDFERLQLAMELVGFLPTTRKQIFSLLSAILHLGNIRYKKKTYRDDSIDICNLDVLPIVSQLLEVKEEMLFEALTTRKTVTVGERLIVPYKLAEAGTVRDSMAKSLYSALFDWIVFRINHALLNNKDLEESAKILSIGVLDIFGFEDYESNSFEQFCINFANERLQHYFNQHTFKLEQEEYRSEGIAWHHIDYIDNTGCINLISKKPTALFHLLDEETFRHRAGRMRSMDFREKNTDHMRPDIVALLKSSRNAFICGLMGIDPVATFRWAVLRAYFRAVVSFREAGRRFTGKKPGHDDAAPCAVLKSVDSFSFLQHPVHQRSLAILQRCKEEKYSITRKTPRSPLSSLQSANPLSEKAPRDTLGVRWNGRPSRQSRLSSGSLLEDDGIFLNSTSSKLLERAHGILMRNRNYKTKPCLPKHLLDIKSLKYLSGLTLQDRITKSLLHLHKKKKPPSISAQFQVHVSPPPPPARPAPCPALLYDDVRPVSVARHGLQGALSCPARRPAHRRSICAVPQDFAHHFHALLPDTSSITPQSMRSFLQQASLTPDGYQVGHTMVFLREAERQQLQDLLHQEVLRRIVALQLRWRAALERRRFLVMRLAACLIQRWWRRRRLQGAGGAAGPDRVLRAALCLQAAWRGFSQRRQFLLWREAALVIQRNLRLWRRRRAEAASAIQAAWRGHRQRERYLRMWGSVLLLQAAARGAAARRRFKDLKAQKLRERQLQDRPQPEDGILATTGLDLSTWEERLCQEREWGPLGSGAAMGGTQEQAEEEKAGLRVTSSGATAGASSAGVLTGKEMPQVLEDPSHKTRVKREKRRKRELEQAKFSLTLLKVRSTSALSPSEERNWPSEKSIEPLSPSEERNWPSESQSHKGSFELYGTDDYPKDLHVTVEVEGTSSTTVIPEQTQSSPTSPSPPGPVSSDGFSTGFRADFMSIGPSPKIENNLPTFYIPPHEKPITDSSPAMQQAEVANHLKEMKEPSQKPLVVLISMQKDSSLYGSQQKAAELRDRSVQTSPCTPGAEDSNRQAVLQRLEKMNEEKEERLKQQQQQKEREMMEQIRQQTENLKKQRKCYAQYERDLLEKQRGEALLKIEQSRQRGLAQEPAGRKPERPGHLHLPGTLASPGILDAQMTENLIRHGKQPPPQTSLNQPIPSLEGRPVMDGWAPKLTLELQEGLPRGRPHIKVPIQGLNTATKPTNIFFTPKDNKLTVSNLTFCFFVFSLGGRMRGKMRFWGKMKQGEKKAIRSLARPQPASPPHSPTLPGERGKEFKDNKEPSPKMKRRRSVKISGVALEPAAWQNDALQILTSAADYRSMNDFLMKKINDLDTEDSKKDTLVDVVFKKALKEFRLNIFNSYSTVLAMDDGKCIRCKDLYALFEQILEKTMRLEQRVWAESPVKVWVNTFKVFLDEFMTEYKPLDSAASKVAKPDRKKRRKKDADIVEEHSGHIFRSAQYSIPTYCEYCSSLIWMMDRACVCKLCRYACHRKCCLKTTTKCSKKYEPELTSRQFGVEVTRLTNDERTVPLVVEKLINYIEMHGLYTEGIYRKSGSANKIKELKQGLDTDLNSMNLDEYNIHVIASVLKQWLRDLPNPLMTFELYEEFLRAMGLQDRKEVIRSIYSVIDQLSRTHLSTLERLIFHLVRVALQEETNRMSANALAIVFAPCILRCPDTIDPLQSVQDISRTTACVELIIDEQMNKYKARLKDISSLEFAENKAKCRLTLIRRSMGKGRHRRGSQHVPSPPASPRPEPVPHVPEEPGPEEGPGDSELAEQQIAMQQEERVLTEQIENLQKEKEELTFEMLTLEPRASDDETLESEASIGTADSLENLNVDSEEAVSDYSGKLGAHTTPGSRCL